MNSSIDWNLLRYMYEVHGSTVEELAEENGTSEQMVKYVSEQQGWKQTQLAKSATDWTDVSDHRDEDVIEEVQQRMSAVSLLRQIAVNPKLQAFETALLNKAIDATHFVDITMPNSADALCKLGDLLDKLKESNPALKALNKKSEAAVAGNNSIKVQIVTGYTDSQKDVIEVSTPTLPENSSKQLPPSSTIPYTTVTT